MRLLSANLFSRFVDVEDWARVIDQVNPDLVVAVELIPEAADVIAERFPHHMLQPDPGYLGWGMASVYPAVFDAEPQPWRGGRGEVEVNGTRVRFAGVHITDPVFGNWYRNALLRRSQIDAVLDWVDGNPGPLVVAGDFNASPAWKVYRRMYRRLDDMTLLAARRSGQRPRPTWGPGVKLLRIDHVFGRGLTPHSAANQKVAGSDHLAVIVDFEVVTPDSSS